MQLKPIKLSAAVRKELRTPLRQPSTTPRPSLDGGVGDAVLVVGHERTGVGQDVLDLLDRVVEIPVWGLPFSYNAATAACLAMYEYCRQFPHG